MSQIGNKIRAGYFATPDRQGEYLRQLISFPYDTSAFDPTCGEGLILRQLTEDRDSRSTTLSTYGVELDKARATQAKQALDVVIQSPIESMVISNDIFGFLFLNPPYDHTMLGYGDEASERKEYTELIRNNRYLKEDGVMIYIIPSYRFADKKIARYLSTNFHNVAITRFTDEDYPDFRQCIFIGKKRGKDSKGVNEKLHEFLLAMEDEEFILSKVSPLTSLIGRKEWEVPAGHTEIPTFYTRMEDKSEHIDAIRNNKGFHAFKERTKPKSLVIGGNPIINIAQGQMALLLASGAVNGLIGEGDTLHAVQGMELVSKQVTQEKTEHSIVTKSRTKRDVSVKIICPNGAIRKLV